MNSIVFLIYLATIGLAGGVFATRFNNTIEVILFAVCWPVALPAVLGQIAVEAIRNFSKNKSLNHDLSRVFDEKSQNQQS